MLTELLIETDQEVQVSEKDLVVKTVCIGHHQEVEVFLCQKVNLTVEIGIGIEAKIGIEIDQEVEVSLPTEDHIVGLLLGVDLPIGDPIVEIEEGRGFGVEVCLVTKDLIVMME